METKKFLNVFMAGVMALGSFQVTTYASTKDANADQSTINETATPYAIDFSEDFGSNDGDVIDPTVWNLAVGSKMERKKDPTIAEGQAGRGYSFYTDGVNKSFIEHTFDNYIRGKVSVAFYDDGTKAPGRMAQVNLIGTANDKNGNKAFTIGLGINQNTATQGYSNDNYSARIADDGRYIDTKIKRTEGWHTFTMECGEEGTKLWIDEQAVDIGAIPEKDIVTAFNKIQLGDKWGKGGETYFDDITLENMTIVDMDAEEAAKHDATLKAIYLNGTALPGFATDKTDYTWNVASYLDLPEVSAETTNKKAKVSVAQADSTSKKAIITVTAADGTTTQTYTVTFAELPAIDTEWSSSFEGDLASEGWQTLDSRGTYTETTNEQAHEGTKSFVTRGTSGTKSWIFKKFDHAINGKVSVWFYDTNGTKGKESFQQVNIWAPFEDVNDQPAIVGLGTNGGTNYVIRTGTASGYQATTVVRSVGWHEFTFDATSGDKIVFAIDGQTVHETTQTASIGALQMGDIWSGTGATAYYDDVKITDIEYAVSGIVLDHSQLSIPSGDQKQLNATVIPSGTTSNIKWSSSNDKIASVDANGLVTAGNSIGTATITATTEKGKYSASCEVTVTKAAFQDASLKSIKVNGKDLNGFKMEESDYSMTIVNGKVPSVTAEANQSSAKVKITNATKIPGTTTIEVTAPDGVSKQTYSIAFKELENVFFDDFSYADAEEMEKKGNWDVQEGTGRRPGNRSNFWSKDHVVLMQDKDDPDNTIVRLKATTDGKPGANTKQSQFRYYEEKFGPGVYVAKVWLYDDVKEAEGAPGTGAWKAKDQGLSTFFTINRIEGPRWEAYHESDFEYLFNGGWGAPAKTMHYTTWHNYSLETSSEGQKDQNSTTGHTTASLDGQWRILTIKIGENGTTTYYVDGVQKASHPNKDKIIGPQSIAFNLWFTGGLDASTKGLRTYWEDVDWVYYTPDTSATTKEIETVVEDMKTADLDQFDDIAQPDISLKSIAVDGQQLAGFNNATTDYTITLPKGTKAIPEVTAIKNNEYAIVDITSAKALPGTTTVYVQSSDLSVTKTFHINFVVEGNKGILAPLSNFASGSSVKYRDVKLYHPHENAEIYYTTDGSIPKLSSKKYEGEVIRVEESTNIKAIAVVNGKKSEVADFLYTVIPMTPQVSQHPVANLNTGTYTGTQYLELSMPKEKQQAYEIPGRTDNYRIYYTTDGTIPTVTQGKTNPSTKLYTGPIKVDKTTTINYIAVLPGISESYESSDAGRNTRSRVTLTINPVAGKEDTTITIDSKLDKIFDEESVNFPELTVLGSDGQVTYTWFKKETNQMRLIEWTKLDYAPTDAGDYKVIVSVEADGKYNAASAETEFSIKQKKGAEVNIPEIDSNDDLDSLAIMYGDSILVEGRDYTITKKEIGDEVEVAIQFMGNYTGTITRKYSTKAIDKSALLQAIAKAIAVDKNKYTAESLKAFEIALKKAQSIYSNDNATQDEVDQITAELLKAYGELKAKNPDGSVDKDDNQDSNQDNNEDSNKGNDTDGVDTGVSTKADTFALTAGLALVTAMLVVKKKREEEQ